jgi:tetratricopeptide (TPR) repeat protein
MDPQNYKACNNLGNLYKQQKNWKMALAYFDRALEIYPKYITALKNKCETLHAIGDHTSACEITKMLLEWKVEDAEKFKERYCR